MDITQIRTDYRKLKAAVAVLKELELTYGEMHYIHRAVNLDIPMVVRLRDMFLEKMKKEYVSERTVAAQTAVDQAIAAEG